MPDPADLALIRLLQLCSGSLPIGGFSFSQGIEWAVAAGWIHDQVSLGDWLSDLAATNLASVEIPLLARLYHAVEAGDDQALDQGCQWLLARARPRWRSSSRNSLVSRLARSHWHPWSRAWSSPASTAW